MMFNVVFTAVPGMYVHVSRPLTSPKEPLQGTLALPLFEFCPNAL